MEKNSLIIIGGSAGSIDVLLHVLPGVDRNLKTPVVIVTHRGQTEHSLLADLLASRTQKRIKEIEDKEKLEPGWIYVAPGDYHLLFEKDFHCSLDTSEKVNYSRPSIDVAFQSAADVYGKNVTAILLSGANNDGTDGLNAVKKAGGKVIIQRPDSAKVPYMVKYALEHAEPDLVLDPDELISYFSKLKTG